MTYKCLSAFEQIDLQKQNFRLKLALLVFSIVFFVCGFAVGDWHAQPTSMQKMLGIHDHMRSAEIRYWWRQTYCGDVKGNPDLVIEK